MARDLVSAFLIGWSGYPGLVTITIDGSVQTQRATSAPSHASSSILGYPMATSTGMLRCAAVAGASVSGTRASGRGGTSFRASVAQTRVAGSASLRRTHARSGAVITRASIEQAISDLATGVGLPCTVRRQYTKRRPLTRGSPACPRINNEKSPNDTQRDDD